MVLVGRCMKNLDSLGIDVANTSLGYRIYNNSSYSYSQEEMDGNTAFITRGSNIAYEKGNNSWSPRPGH